MLLREATAAARGLAAPERVDGNLPRLAAFANDQRAPAGRVEFGDDPCAKMTAGDRAGVGVADRR